MKCRATFIVAILLISACTAETQRCVTVGADKNGGCMNSACDGNFCARSIQSSAGATHMPGFSVRKQQECAAAGRGRGCSWGGLSLGPIRKNLSTLLRVREQPSVVGGAWWLGMGGS